MDGSSIDLTVGALKPNSRLAREPVRDVILLLDAAANQLPAGAHEAHCMIREAVSLLEGVTEPRVAKQVPRPTGGLLGWQVRKILQYVNDHLASRILVADLCALLELSKAHFSRSFRRTFGESPHAFVLRYRLEMAARQMLHTNASLSEIALLCGFSDQAHLSTRFRQASGQTPAAWRRARRDHDAGANVSVSSLDASPPRSEMRSR